METALPISLRDIEAAIGRDRTMDIVQSYGGQRLWIPSIVTFDWVILPILRYDFDLAQKLVKLCGGNQISVPCCHRLKVSQRHQNIIEDRRVMSIGALAGKYHLSRRQIQAIVNKAS